MLKEQLSETLPTADTVTIGRGELMLLRAFLREARSSFAPGPYMRIGLCTSSGGTVEYALGRVVKQTHWGRRHVFITLPGDEGLFHTPDLEMIGLAIHLESFGCGSDLATLRRLQTRVLSDRFIALTIEAMWEAHCLDDGIDAFVRAGANSILRRLKTLALSDKSTSHRSGLSRDKLRELSRMVESHSPHLMTGAELAARVGWPERRFSAALMQATGYSPSAFITRGRMKYARRLLAQGTKVTDVALEVGYANPSKFAAAFRRHVGCSPTEWKKASDSV